MRLWPTNRPEMAERAGFEPARSLSASATFPRWCTKPLCDPSVRTGVDGLEPSTLQENPWASTQQMLARSVLPWLGTDGQGLRCGLEVMTPLLLRSRSLTSTRFPHRCASGSVVLIVIALRKMRGSNPRDVAVLPVSNRLPYLSANLPEVGSPQPQVRFLGVPCNFRHSPQLPH